MLRMRSYKITLLTIALLASVSLSLAQNMNQAAVDTMTKEVAMTVFAHINQPKAQEIYTQLLGCGDGCDPQAVIRGVGGWDAVGVKMQELSELKNTQRFQAMTSTEANTAIHRQLAQFYVRYKNDNNYGKPLSPAVQERILAKVDQMLPPVAAVDPAPAVSNNQADTPPTVTGDEAPIDPTTFQISQLEREVKEKQEKQLWMMIVSGLIGLLVGAGAVYLLAYRGAQAELKAAQDTNNRLQNALETAERNKTGPDLNAIRVDYRQKANAYDAILVELGTNDPLMAIRQLKQGGGNQPKSTPVVRSGEPQVKQENPPAPEPEQAPVQDQPIPEPAPIPAPAPVRHEVFYLPPPDANGQFDLSYKSGSLLPESAYRFSVSAEDPAVASFRFEADPSRLARFLTYRNYMIEPACESENTYSTAHTRVAIRRDGVAVLENGTWRVKTKALIRYE